MEAGTRGVTWPKKALRRMSRLSAPVTSISTLRAAITDRRLFGARRLLRAFPGMHNLRHSEVLEALKAELEEKLRR